MFSVTELTSYRLSHPGRALVRCGSLICNEYGYILKGVGMKGQQLQPQPQAYETPVLLLDFLAVPRLTSQPRLSGSTFPLAWGTRPTWGSNLSCGAKWDCVKGLISEV